MKIMVLAVAALVATSFSAAAEHEGKADSDLAQNDIFGGGLAVENRLTGSVAASVATGSAVTNGAAEGALVSHSPTAVVECNDEFGDC